MLARREPTDHASTDADVCTRGHRSREGRQRLATELEAQGLFFPVTTLRGVCLGGYSLQGGYGWNSRIYGPACESVIGLTSRADGAQIHYDDNHADLYSKAASGLYVVTSFYLKLY